MRAVGGVVLLGEVLPHQPSEDGMLRCRCDPPGAEGGPHEEWSEVRRLMAGGREHLAIAACEVGPPQRNRTYARRPRLPGGQVGADPMGHVKVPKHDGVSIDEGKGKSSEEPCQCCG